MDNVFYLKPSLHQALNNYKKPKLENKDLPSSFAGNLEDMQLILNTLKVPYKVDSKEEMMTTSIVRNDSIFLIDRPKGENLIPNVVGMGVRDALYVLENEGVQVKFKGKGKVQKQSIRPGTRIAGQTIHLTLG
jgi:cell division protein FtsI (penicillin-binding protein 3)